MSNTALFIMLPYFCLLDNFLWCIILVFVGGHLWLVCGIPYIAMQFGMSVSVSIALMLIFIPSISSSLFTLWFCLDSQSAMNRSGPGLKIIFTLYWWILISMHCNLCDNVPISFWRLIPEVCVLLFYLPPWQSSNNGASPNHVVWLMLLFPCCCIFFLLLTGSL